MPLLRYFIHLSIQLTHRNSFRIQDLRGDFFEIWICGFVAKAQSCHTHRQSLETGGLTRASRAHDHDAKPHIERIKELDDLGHEFRDGF